MNAPAQNEAIGLSKSGTKQLQLSGRSISRFLDRGWMGLSGCLGRKVIVTLSVTEGASKGERDERTVKESVGKKKTLREKE